jgi:hypothetical protein
MKIILIVVFLHGYGPRHTVQFQEFESMRACQVAAKTIESMRRLHNYTYSCVPKG